MGAATKLGRSLGAASLLAGVLAVAAPMASTAWASSAPQTASCKDDHASPTGDANQTSHVKNETTTSTCQPCVTTDGKGDHESPQGAANESSGRTGGTTSTVGTATIASKGGVVASESGGKGGNGGNDGGGGSVGAGGSGSGGSVGNGWGRGKGSWGGGSCGTGGGGSGSGGSGSGGSGSGGSGSGGSGSGGSGSGSGSTGGSSTTASGGTTSAPPAVAPVVSPTPEVVSTTPSGLVVHTVVVPTEVQPAQVPAAGADVPTQVLGVSTLRDAPVPTLAYTGGSVTKLFVVGAALVLLGLALLVASHRRYELQH